LPLPPQWRCEGFVCTGVRHCKRKIVWLTCGNFFSRTQRPDDVSKWTAQHVWSWLHEQQFPDDVFEEDAWADVDGEELLGLMEAALEHKVKQGVSANEKLKVVDRLFAKIRTLNKKWEMFGAPFLSTTWARALFFVCEAAQSSALMRVGMLCLLCSDPSAGISRGDWCGPGEFRCCSGRCDLGSVWS
jgi:hypothetical protein